MSAVSDAPSAIPFRSHFCQPPSTLCTPVPAMYDLEIRLHPIFSQLLLPLGTRCPLKERVEERRRKRGKKRWIERRTRRVFFLFFHPLFHRWHIPSNVSAGCRATLHFPRDRFSARVADPFIDLGYFSDGFKACDFAKRCVDGGAVYWFREGLSNFC